MIRSPWALSNHIRACLSRNVPIEVLLDTIGVRLELKWGVPERLIAVPYLQAASICTALITNEGPGYLNLFVRLLVRNALKLLIMGPVSFAGLVRAQHVETKTETAAG